MSVTTSAAASTCPECGEAVTATMARCKNCGKALKAPSASPAAPANGRPSGPAKVGPRAIAVQDDRPFDHRVTVAERTAVVSAQAVPPSAAPTTTAAEARAEVAAPSPAAPAVAPSAARNPSGSSDSGDAGAVSASDDANRPPDGSVGDLLVVACRCGKRYRAPRSRAGRKFQCTDCNQQLTVPGEPDAATSGQPSPAAAKPSDSGAAGMRPAAVTRAPDAIESPTDPGKDRPTDSMVMKRPSSRDVIFVMCVCGTKMGIPKRRAATVIDCPQCGKPVTLPVELVEDAKQSAAADDDSLSPQYFRDLSEKLKEQIDSEIAATKGRRKKTLGLMRYKALRRLIVRSEVSVPPDERKAAIAELGASKDPRAFDLLVRLLDPEEEPHPIREVAVSALGACEDPRAIPPLLTLLDVAHSRLHVPALQALCRHADRRTIRPMMTFGQEYPHHRYLVSDGIVKMEEPAVLELLDILNDKDPGMVLEGVVLLGRLKNEKAVPALIQIIETRSAYFRAHAAESLGLIGDRRGLTILIRLLQDKDPNVRLNAATALTKIPDSQALRPLIGVLTDEDAEVVLAAIHALCEVNDARASDALRPFLKSPSTNLRIAAAEALGRFGDELAVPPLIELLASTDEAVKLKAISSLRRIKSAQAISALLPLLHDSSDVVRLRTVDTLGQIGNAAVARKLEFYLKNDRSEVVRAGAAKALGDLSDPESVEPLVDALRDVFAVKCRAIVSLGSLKQTAALGAVISMLRDPMAEARYHACGALAELAPPNAVKLLEPLIDDSNAMVRRGVAKALQKLGDPRGDELGKDSMKHSLRRTAKATRAQLAGLFSALLPDWLLGLVWPATWARRGAMIGVVALIVAGGFLLAGGSSFSMPDFLSGGEKVYLRGAAAHVAISPDGKWIAVPRSVALVEMFDDGGRRRKWAKVSAGPARFIDDGTTLVFVQGGNLVFWKHQTEKAPQKVIAGHGNEITSLAVSPDGRWGATIDPKGILVQWNLVSGAPLAALQLSKDETRSQPIAISSDGKMIAVFDRAAKTVSVWDVATVAVAASYPTKSLHVTSLAFSPDSTQLAIGGPEHLEFHKLAASGADSVEEVKGMPSRIDAMSYTPDGRRLAFVSESNVYVVDVASKESRSFVIPRTEVLTSLSIAADGKRAAVCGPEETFASIVDLDAGKVEKKLDAN